MKHRIFIGIDLPPQQKDLIAHFQSSLLSHRAYLSVEPPEKLHLTLNFLGRIEEEILNDLQRRLPEWLAPVSAFSLRFSFLESLYRRHETSLVYLAPTGDIDQLKELHQGLNIHLSELKLSQPERFLPHVTIAKFAKSDPLTTKTWLDQIVDFPFSPLPVFSVDTVTVFESLLSKHGSTYRKIGNFKL